jgi:23S rRNA pseudouridine1911/1915/1917 synthase
LRSTPLDIIHEDRDVLLVNKPAGLLTSTVPREKRPTLLAQVWDYLERTDPRARCGLIHRLDRDARGLLIFSKNDEAYQSLKSQFFHHTVERVYMAVTVAAPNPREGRVTNPLTERADGTVRIEKIPGKGESAITDYVTLKVTAHAALVRVVLQTGRKHQIRVHLARRGAPILGDPVYASPPHNRPPMLLAAVHLGFVHPRTNKEVRFQIPLPAEFKAHLKEA